MTRPRVTTSVGSTRVKFAALGAAAGGMGDRYPPDFDPSRKYPLFVDVHGGGPRALYLIGGSSQLQAPKPRGPTWPAQPFDVIAMRSRPAAPIRNSQICPGAAARPSALATSAIA